MVCVNIHHQVVLKGLWGMEVARSVLGQGSLCHVRSSIEKHTADLQWRLDQGAKPTHRHVAHLNPTVGMECLFVGDKRPLTISSLVVAE